MMDKDFIHKCTNRIKWIQGRCLIEVEWNDGSFEYLDEDHDALKEFFHDEEFEKNVAPYIDDGFDKEDVEDI